MNQRLPWVVAVAVLSVPLSPFSMPVSVPIEASIRFREAMRIETKQTPQQHSLSAWFPEDMLPQVKYCNGLVCKTYIPARKSLPLVLAESSQNRPITVQISYF